MPPQRGLGGNNAFEDARLLVQLLTTHTGGLKPDISEYERQMFLRARIAVEESNEAAQMCHLQNRFAAKARNTVLKLLGFATRMR